MSGLEVAGVVLGAIPILVEALKSYADGVATIKTAFTYEETYLEIHSSLVVSLTVFQHSCEELLRDLVLPPSQFVALVDKHEGWDDPDLTQKLKSRLGERDFDVYMKFAGRLRKRIVLLGDKLQLRKDFTPVFVIDGKVDHKKCKQFFKSPMTRMRGAFESTKLKKVVEDIANDVRRLRELSKDAPKLEEERKERATASVSAYWLSMRNHASLLFTALQSMWPRACQMHEHLVNLRVTRPECQLVYEDLAITQLCFHLEAGGKVEIQRQVTFAPTSPAQIPAAGTKKIRFATDPQNSPKPAQNKVCKQEQIQDLCTSLHKHCAVDCLGYLHINTSSHHYHLHGVQDWPQSTDLIPLRQLLLSRTKTRSTISTRERCNYSIQLASAVMQLFDTSWLSPSWTLDDIYVNNTQETNGQIYIPSLFDDQSPSSACAPTTSFNDTPTFVKNQIVFALGIALIELCHSGKELSHFATPADLDKDGNPHMLTRWSIADRLTEEVQRTESLRFARAVAKCVCPASDTYEFGLENEGYRMKFYEDVLKPLERDWDVLFGA
ncbi:hypothetical protein DM02DRAFT_676704 [Periconia macrospinosa]|uniref:DUF7580 domain-containing protein n=1 Tax=Periconia macrospinosa TaxID=97972 RepID=A0A2V1D910_9PLEO|nr:hypothetical protein DM02DRAFT_676704 [Periconia macrospinosa]